MALDKPTPQTFDPTRAAGEATLRAFAPRMGQAYEKSRNFDRGPGQHSAVSQLSPYLRRRLVTEQDAVAAALSAHGPENAEKFIQEVVWRSYFKGWLERRPIIWDQYRDGLARDLAALDRDRGLRARYQQAVTGNTGLDYVDAWAEELNETGYLHNHARMWFASIWIFTLDLPWRLGADYFYRHLIDGDPASNTLGWRWVAGLHTRGKPYQAQAWNIAQFTGNRFDPDASDLAEVVEGREHEEPDGLPNVCPVRTPAAPDPTQKTALLITEEDCRPEDFDLQAIDIVGCATLTASHLRSPLDVAPAVAAFEDGALTDAAKRAGFTPTALKADTADDLVTWAQSIDATQIATPFVPTGPLRDWLDGAQPALDAEGITLTEWRRDWDDAIWPYATAGFFKVKKQIPKVLHRVGLS
ncbi:MAG: FAD-binding domain-containing protein [Pseudomonadota bacterium]